MRRRHLIWTSMGILALLAGLLFHAFPSMAETIYGRGVFPMIRWLVTSITSWLPIPVITVLFIVCLTAFWFTAIKPLIRKSWTYKSFFVGLLSTLGAAVFFFQFLWGFNYARPAWDQRLDLQVNGMTVQQLADEYERATQELRAAVERIDDVDELASRGNSGHEVSVVQDLRDVLARFDFPLSKTPRVRIVRPKGILMRWNTAGIYVPYSGEGHVDAGMLPVQIPFTLAHEMAHGFGVADEADCNFLAYLACRQSEDPVVRFAGIFSYWRYVAGEYRFTSPEAYRTAYETLPELVKSLLLDIRLNDAKYPDIFPKLRNAVYDTYLKSQGVHDGLMSYNRVIQLVWAFEKKDGKSKK